MEASLKNESLEGMKVVWDGNWEVEVDWEIHDEGGRVEWEVMFISQHQTLTCYLLVYTFLVLFFYINATVTVLLCAKVYSSSSYCNSSDDDITIQHNISYEDTKQYQITMTQNTSYELVTITPDYVNIN